MGLHAGLYTQHLSSRNLTHHEKVFASDDLSLFKKELLKDLSNKATCPQCRKIQSEWQPIRMVGRAGGRAIVRSPRAML